MIRSAKELADRLYPFQRRAVSFHLSHHYSVNGCKMGLGKTIQAIALISHVQKNVCIVCPAYLKSNWQRELDNFLPMDFTQSIEIISYDMFRRINPKNIDILIFDEAHYLKNMKSKRTVFAHEYVKNNLPEYLLMLTGTPVQNRVTEFYSLLRLCSYNPKNTSGTPLVKSFHVFATALSYRHILNTPYGPSVKYTGLRNKPLLIKYLKDKYFTAENDKKMPELFRQTIIVDAIKNKNLIEQLEDDFRSNHISTAKKNIAIEKAKFTAKYIIDCAENDELPLLVFSDHVESCHEIEKLLVAKNLKVQVITGKTHSVYRGQYVKQFQQKEIDVIIGTIGSMSTGFTLTATNRVIFNDLSWTPANNEQAEKRIHRIGQDRDCFVVTILSEGIDRKIVEVLQEKQKTLDRLYSS